MEQSANQAGRTAWRPFHISFADPNHHSELEHTDFLIVVSMSLVIERHSRTNLSRKISTAMQ